MGLLLPAVQSARERARQATCTTNLSELGKAMVSYATSGKGVFPGSMQLQLLDQNAGDGYPLTSGGQPDIEISWAAKLLPHIDLQSDWNDLLAGYPPGNPVYSLDVSSSPDRTPRRDIFICPSSPPTIKAWGALSYVANTGAPDIMPNSGYSQSDFVANGICHNLISTPVNMRGPQVRFGADLQDGAAKTLLLSENVHKDEAGSSIINSSWLRSSAFYLGPSTGFGEQPFGMVWVYDPSNYNNPSSQARINRLPDPPPNQPFATFGPAYARPASEHPELVIAVFAGGNVQSISDQIEYRVYQQLMTPNGRNARYPGLDVNATNTMRNNFHSKMLSDSDY
jgi:hypothetical protein